MAILDINLVLSNNQTITTTAPSAGIIDLAGVGVGNPPTNTFGTATVFGEDIGIGDGASPPNLTCIVGTSFAAGGAGTLQVQIQASVDTGAPGYTPAAWTTIVETPPLSLAQLTAGTKIAEYTIPPRAPGQAYPRFYRLNYVVATGPMTAGTIAFAGIATGRDDTPMYPGGILMRGEQNRMAAPEMEPPPETDRDLGIGEEHDPVGAMLANPAMAALIDQAIARRLGAMAPAAGPHDPMAALLAAIERMTMIHATQAPGYSKPLSTEVIESRRAGFEEMVSLIEVCQAENKRPRYKLVGEPLFAGEIEYLPGSEISTFLIPNEHMAPLNDEARAVHSAMMKWIGGPQMSIAERVEQAERERRLSPTAATEASPFAAPRLPDQSPVQIVAEPDDVRQFDPRRPPHKAAHELGTYQV